jgi:hypothetical protein
MGGLLSTTKKSSAVDKITLQETGNLADTKEKL